MTDQDRADQAEAQERGVSVESLRKARELDLSKGNDYAKADPADLAAIAAATYDGRRVVSLEEWRQLTRRDQFNRKKT